MDFSQEGKTDGPILVCIPGLLGGKEDFHKIFSDLSEQFNVIIFDPNKQTRVEVGLKIDIDVMKKISYSQTTMNLKEMLTQKFPNQTFHFLGISIGGNIVFEFASQFPALFQSGVVTDVGLGSFQHSDLFKFIQTIVDQVDLSLPWPELKQSLHQIIPDKNLRLLLQTQITYPNKTPPAVWKVGITEFANLLSRQHFEDLAEKYSKIDHALFEKNSYIDVLKSDNLSGICPESLKTMNQLKSIRLQHVPNSTHFLQMTHPLLIRDFTLSMLKN